jgi:outer membrane protein assembly factor BamB
VHCFSSKDGAKIWSTPIPESIPETSVLGKNGYASSTPVTDGERVIVFLGSSGLVCLDFAGKIQWQYNNLNIKTTHGTGSSPVIHGDLVLFFHDQNQSDSICIALDKKTGKEIWKQKRDKGMTWCTPVVIKVGDHDEVIFAGSGTVRGYDPATGNELWKLQGPTSEVVPTIVVGTELAYSASGRNGPTIAFRLGEKGDITASSTVWKSVRNGPHVPSPILVKDKLFTFNDMGISTCLDATTGKLLWTERLPDQFTASPIEAGGFIYVSGESGKTYVLKVSDKFELVATNDLGSPILASPAIVDGNLLLRTRDALYCIGMK